MLTCVCFMHSELFSRSIVLPISKEFKPDIVLVSAGFDAMDGHDSRIGGYKVSAACEYCPGACAL